MKKLVSLSWIDAEEPGSRRALKRSLFFDTALFGTLSSSREIFLSRRVREPPALDGNSRDTLPSLEKVASLSPGFPAGGRVKPSERWPRTHRSPRSRRTTAA